MFRRRIFTLHLRLAVAVGLALALAVGFAPTATAQPPEDEVVVETPPEDQEAPTEEADEPAEEAGDGEPGDEEPGDEEPADEEPAAEALAAEPAAAAFAAEPLVAAFVSASTVFINEIHYDNDGADAGEFVEIAGPAGTDMTGWTIELYNGSNGTVYDTIGLDGTISDQNNGYGVLVWTPSSIQNGSPDGLALVDPDGMLIQFLSYEGTMVGVGGTADGVESTDIGVSETGSTPVGQSLQLTGSGTMAMDFVWTGPATNSAGDVNAGQDFAGGPSTPDLAITEIHYDNDGSDVGEFFEIAGPAGTDLTGWSVVLYNGSNASVYNTIALTGVIDDEDGTQGAVDFQLPANGLQNGAPDGLALIDPDGVVVEFLSYEGTMTALGGPADGTASTDIGVAEAGSTPIGESLQLFDGVWTGPAANSAGSLNTPPTPPTPDLAITEIHYDNDGSDVGEFFEVTGPAGADLTGWSVALYNGSNASVYNTIALTGTIDDEDGTQGAVDFQLPANGLQNGAPDGLALIDPDGVVVEFLSYEGELTAVGGPALGQTSTDIGVAEAGSTPIGESLQLFDGVWTGPAANSAGSLNTPATPPQPFVSEIHYDNDGSDVGEFFEIAGPAGTDLAGWTVALYNGSNASVYNTIALTGTIDDEDGTQGAVDFQLPANGLQNGAPTASPSLTLTASSSSS